MEIRPIHTDDDYKIALREVSAYFDSEPAPGTPDGDRFEVLLTLVEEVRVILIKQADRLQNIRTLQALTRKKQIKIDR